MRGFWKIGRHDFYRKGWSAFPTKARLLIGHFSPPLFSGFAHKLIPIQESFFSLVCFLVLWQNFLGNFVSIRNFIVLEWRLSRLICGLTAFDRYRMRGRSLFNYSTYNINTYLLGRASLLLFFFLLYDRCWPTKSSLGLILSLRFLSGTTLLFY